MCRAIQLSLQYGNTPVSAAVYSAYGLLQGIALGKFERGYAMGKVGMELSNRYNIPSIQSRTYTMFGGVLCQFVGDAREGDMYLKDAIQMGMNSGDYIFASYAIGAHVNSLYTRAPLGQFSKILADYLTVLETTKDEFVRQNIYLYQQYILALQGKTGAPDSFSRAHFDENEFLERISGKRHLAPLCFNIIPTKRSYVICSVITRKRCNGRGKPDPMKFMRRICPICRNACSMNHSPWWPPVSSPIKGPHGRPSSGVSIEIYVVFANGRHGVQ